MKRIILTGGGTAGHVTPNLALIPLLMQGGWDVHYIGTHQGIERELVAALPGVTYHPVRSGKLRRYFDVKNLTDPFRVIAGAWEAARIIGKLKPQVVFAKGGFVSVPVAYGAWLHRVPLVLHESDLTPGLANKLCAPVARVVCTTFPEAAKAMGAKGVCTGTPLRPALFSGDPAQGLAMCGFTAQRPVLMVTGGSLGAAAINGALRAALPILTRDFQVLHLCGKDHVDPALEGCPGYKQFPYLKEEMPHAFAAADLLLSRAGSNTLSEILALQKPALLVPYPATASRGDQIDNARSLEKRGLAAVLMQEEMTPDTLVAGITQLYDQRARYIAAMSKLDSGDGTQAVLAQILKAART